MSENKSKSRSKYDRANCISKLYCWYVLPFLLQNYKKNFNFDVFDDCSKEHICAKHANRLKRYWSNQIENCGKINKRKPSLLVALVKCFGLLYLWTNVKSIFVYGILRMVMPVLLGRIIFYSNLYLEDDVRHDNDQMINNSSVILLSTDLLQLPNAQNVLLYSVLLCFVIFCHVLFAQPLFMSRFRYGMRFRLALTRLIYEKALRIPNESVQRNTAGKIVNLISNDVSRFDSAYHFWEFVYTGILQTAVGMYFMYLYIGRSCLGTLAIIVLYIPFQTVMANILSRIRSSAIALTDDRLRLMAEILLAMRVIKMYVWEQAFAQLVQLARKLEITKIKHSMILRAVNLALYFVSSKVMSFICIILFLLDGGQLSAENVFVTLALVAQIREIMTLNFPLGISYGVETYISVKRIEAFLLENEIESQSNVISYSANDCRISLNQVSVQLEPNIPILNDISFEVLPGKLTVIIGPVGSGKSSILLAILKEHSISSGSIDIKGKLAFASQEAWIFSGTIRENILFGEPYNSDRFKLIIEMAALSTDLAQFPLGVQTVLDDRGTSLSGGQQARISLARALYRDADCYLLDDPLSAVDASVAKHIFEKCIKQYLVDKCVILVTHQLQFIKQADQIVMIKDGQCVASGTYEELANQNIDLFECASIESEEEGESIASLQTFESIVTNQKSNSFEIDEQCDNISLVENQLICSNQSDESQSHQNKLRIYWIYIRAGAGIVLFSTFFLSNLITQVLFTCSDYWLSVWTDYKQDLYMHGLNPNYTFNKNPIVSEEESDNVWIYSALVGFLFAFSILRTVTFFIICMCASTNLHKQIFGSLMRAPIWFFDKTPIGVIMNRVSRDLSVIDDLLPPAGFEALEILGNSIGVFVICVSLNYCIVLPLILMVILIYFSSRLYVNTARQLMRIESATRSPLYSQMSSSLVGLSTIRSCQAERMLIDQFSGLQDRHTSVYFTFLSASRFFGIFIEFLCWLYICCLVLVINLTLDNYTGGTIGLILSQSLLLTSGFEWGVRQFTVVETYMISVERIVEFGSLDKEDLDKCEHVPGDEWPHKGQIQFENVSLQYRGMSNPVLNQLNCRIMPGEKIGIVGRTGAGKSSLSAALFRWTQPEGQIRIDGCDTARISLATLRRALSIIPQEPILFSGSIHHNLDPFNQKSDEQIWDAIEKVQLKTKIQSLPSQLNSPVLGSDFSAGQKQLICMARAILRKNRILILDEATANVDPQTDGLIQQTIRREFNDCTVLTIAHRIHTIIDYDRVMVLDKGKLVQFDRPYQLIEQNSGIFNQLFTDLNQETQIELKQIAKCAYKISTKDNYESVLQ